MSGPTFSFFINGIKYEFQRRLINKIKYIYLRCYYEKYIILTTRSRSDIAKELYNTKNDNFITKALSIIPFDNIEKAIYS